MKTQPLPYNVAMMQAKIWSKEMFKVFIVKI
jgi:hypothetical protein